MNDDGVPWHTTLLAAIVDPTRRCVLFYEGAAGATLPVLDLDENAWSGTAAARLQEMLRREHGLDNVILRCALEQIDDQAHQTLIVFAVELLDEHPILPTGAFWADRATLAMLPLAQPEQRAILDQILQELEPGVAPPERPAWAHPGWYAQAHPWIADRLSEAGHSLIGPITQIKVWSLSCVLCAPTASGDFYFKQAARLPLFADEPRLMQALALDYPELIPAALAVDLDRGWLLLADLGLAVREDPSINCDVELRERVVQLWGALQRRSGNEPGRLLAGGCLDRRVPKLQAAITPLMAAPDAFPGLEPAEVEVLKALEARLIGLCDELEGFGIPAGLVHGDLHWGNVAHRNGTIAIFDWTDGCLAHPFFDLATLLSVRLDFPEHDAAVERLRTAYLATFEDIAPLPQLRAATRIAEVLGALHQVVSYYSIVNSIEPIDTADLGSGLTFFWREVLRTVQLLETSPTEAS